MFKKFFFQLYVIDSSQEMIISVVSASIKIDLSFNRHQIKNKEDITTT